MTRLRLALLAHLRALALDTPRDGLLSQSLALNAGPLALHLAALLAVARLAHWPLWVAPVLLAAFNLPALLKRRWFSEALAPLIILYGLAALRLVIIYGWRRTPAGVLDYGWALGLSAVWAGAITLQTFGRLRLAAALVALAAAGLMLELLWRQAPAGVTGSDPFAYVQMALDLVQHGTALHSFPLAVMAANLGLPTLPTTHVGYVLPNRAGLAPTVWPPGYSVLLAAAYRLGGEPLLLTFNGWVGLACLVLTAALTVLMAPPAHRRLAWSAGFVAAALLATSPELITRLVTPLADGASLMLTTLAVGVVLFTVRARPASRFTYAALGALAGLSLAAAYSVRYTQVLVAPGLVAAAYLGLRPPRARWSFLAAFAIAAAAGAVPDVIYRVHLYGTPLRFSTGELALFSLQALHVAARQLAAEALSNREFGWLWPLPLLGGLYAWRRARAALLTLLAAYGPLLVFHLWYPFVRLRDLLALYAPLTAAAGLGAVVLLAWFWRRTSAAWSSSGQTWKGLARVAVVAGLLAGGLARLEPVLGFQAGFFTFGYLLPNQRRSLESLAVLTEPDAVIACSLNSGAVELYGRRQTVRPGNLLQPGASWTPDQWLVFVAALQAAGRPVYVLMDSPEMEGPLSDLWPHYTLTHAAAVDVPDFFVGGGSQNMTVALWRVTPWN